ncbi:growth-regulating factor 8-like [Bidens hawaiensis]|uniref:growth-regulating factor 8-like n=1 Tax=Bidens hawaiensis TaxID=980011 RepID=UPI00404B52DE
MGASGKVLFTATQWQELERQNKIYMYIMASVPIPPHLLSPSSVQSNRVSTGLRFSNGSDPEPWRCRRTDGKKWRCAKDVAPDQKYCERHAHKTRSRSRKPVESQLHNVKEHHSQQTRFMKNGTIPVSQSNKQFQLPLQSASGGSRKDHIIKQEFKGNHLQSSCLDRDNHFLNTSGGTDWSRVGGGDGCSLTLSMQSGANDIEFDHESFQMAVGMLRGDKEGCGDGFKPGHQWLNQVSWAGSGGAPGGPLGEALCLGMASSQSESYSHGYSYSTTTSGSCDIDGDGGHGLDFSFVNPHDG